jgi:hypothetical protein
MSVLAHADAPAAQPMLFDRQTVSLHQQPVYDERARAADRELCQRYFRAWCGSVGALDGSPAGHAEIALEQFQAAADRLAEHALPAEH